MKRMMTLVLGGALLFTAVSCGGSGGKTGDVDLEAFYKELQKDFGWNALVETEGEMLEQYYPGLDEVDTEQLIAAAPMMSAVVNELVFLEADSDEDAAAAETILEKRLETQRTGGAWYPESIAAWEKGEVIRRGRYVALIASAEGQKEVAERFLMLFR